MQVYVACFDITDDKIRRNVARRLQHFGTRVQRSVFEIAVRSSTELESLREELGLQLEDSDDLRFYTLCKRCRLTSRDDRSERIAVFPVASIL